MVITQAQFNKALEEINTSYAKLVKRVEELEKAAAESTKSTTTKK